MAGSSIMDNLFQRTTEDLIKGLRLSLVGESAFISKAMDEIRREIKSTDMDTKSTAIQKLSFLSSLHFHDMSFASFHVVELISSPRFSHKRVAYTAAANSFHDSTSVLLLLTNHLRKDLSAPNTHEVTIALQCLSMIATLDLARDLTPEIFSLLGSSKLSVRKKAVAATLRFFEKYPDSARVCFKRLAESLESPDPSVLSAAVGVFCELARRDPESCLPLAPEFYRVFVDCKNNWILIKILKIFSRLAPLEPRLAKRVVEPICDLMRRNAAKSVAFECVRTLVSSFGGFDSAAKLAAGKIREFLAEEDPNLRYLGLNALSIAARDHPWAVSENKEAVIESLSDPDPSVRRESLKLVMAMVTEANAAEISRVLVNYAVKSDPGFCDEILGSILATCSAGVYEIVSDFDRCVSLLGEISRVPHCRRGAEIERQLVDVGVRVRDARPELVRVARDLLIDPALLGNSDLHRILSAAAWVSGEYVEFSRDPIELLDALVQPRANLLPPSVRSVYIHSAFKALVFLLDDSEDLSSDNSVVNLLSKIESGIGPLLGSHDVEVVERSRNLIRFVELIKKSEEDEARGIVEVVRGVFSDELGLVSTTAQERVLVPEGLALKENLEDLDEFLPKPHAPPPSSETFLLEERGLVVDEGETETRGSNESASLLAQHRKRHGLYYLPSEEASENYPPANELGAAVDLSSKKKPSQAKPRPVVVKLDGDSVRDSDVEARSSNRGSLSGAVREALFGSDSKPNSSSEKRPSKGKEILYEEEEAAPKSKEDSSTKSKSRSEKKSSRRHGKHKSRKRTDAVPQTQEIPDFLL